MTEAEFHDVNRRASKLVELLNEQCAAANHSHAVNSLLPVVVVRKIAQGMAIEYARAADASAEDMEVGRRLLHDAIDDAWQDVLRQFGI